MLFQNNDLKKPLIKSNKATKNYSLTKNKNKKNNNKPMLRIPSKNAHDQKRELPKVRYYKQGNRHFCFVE